MRKLVILTMLFGCSRPTSDNSPVEALVSEPAVEEPSPVEPKSSEDSLLPFTRQAIELCGAKMSQAKLAVKAREYARIVSDRIPNQKHAEIYIAMLCTESKFSDSAKSVVGATGVAQVMPRYAQDFANLCGLGTLEESDVNDPTVNLTLGACYFNHLTLTLKPSTLAIAAYNAGANSSSVKKMKALSSPVEETSGYVTKVVYLNEKLKLDSN